MTFLPIVDRELRVAARRHATYWIRVVFAITGTGIIGLAMLLSAMMRTGATRIGGGVFYFLSLLALGFSAFAGVFLTADCLSEEKREGTLGLLFLTDLKGYDVVLGKLLARSLGATYGLIAIFPVLGITLTMGGVTVGEFWRMALVCLNTIFFSLTAGIFVSALSEQNTRSMAGAAVLIVFIGGVLPLAESIFSGAGLAGRFLLALPSPLTAWELAFDSSFRMQGRSFAYSLLLTQAMGWLFLVFASVLLPRVWQSGGGSMIREREKMPSVSKTLRSRRLKKRKLFLEQNPVYWLAVRKSRIIAASGIIWTLAAMGLVLLSLLDPLAAVASSQYWWSLLLGLLRIFVGISACRFFVEARQTGALELLLSTPLTTEEILRGQWMALRRLFLAPTTALFVLGIVPLLFLILTDWPNAFPGGVVMGALCLYGVAPKLACDLLAAAWVGMLVGLTARKPNLAPGLTVLYTVVLPVAAFCVPDVMITFPLMLWARDRLYRQLRMLSSTRFAPVAPLYGSGGGTRAVVPPVIRL